MKTTTHVRRGQPRLLRWLRPALTALVAVAPALAGAGCSEGYDAPPLAPACSAGPCPLGMVCDDFTGFCAPKGDYDCATDNEPSQGDMCSQDCVPRTDANGITQKATCAGGLGTRYCTCEGGVFLQCACIPPEDPALWPYDDVPAAPYCDKLDTFAGEPRYMRGDRCPGPGHVCRSSTGRLNTTEPVANVGCVCEGAVGSGLWGCGDVTTLGIPEDAPICEDTYRSGLQLRLKDKPCDTEFQLCVARDYNPEGTSPRGCVCLRDGGQLGWYCSSTQRWWRAE